jgi:hypothetical protein
LVRRIGPPPASEKTIPTARLQVAPAQFLLHHELIEDGGLSGGNGEAQGCSERRRWSASERLGFRFGEFFLQREGRTRASACHGAFIGRRSKPRHDVEPGEVTSERPGRARRRAVLHAGRRDEDELLSLIFQRRGKLGCGLGCVGGLLLGCVLGCGGPPGKPGRLSSFPFVFCFHFYFLF